MSENKVGMIILVPQYWTFNPHHVLMSLWWHCALQLPPTHTLYRQTGTRADAAPMKTNHCALYMFSLSCDTGVYREYVSVWACLLLFLLSCVHPWTYVQVSCSFAGAHVCPFINNFYLSGMYMDYKYVNLCVCMCELYWSGRLHPRLWMDGPPSRWPRSTSSWGSYDAQAWGTKCLEAWILLQYFTPYPEIFY